MKKQLTAIVLTVLIVLSSGITTLAAPELRNADGVWITFDSEYYAANNPDVVAVLGTDANALFQHYITAGQYEGRLCCAPGTQVGTAEILSKAIYNSDVVITPATHVLKTVYHKPDGTIKSSVNFVYDSKGNLIRRNTENGLDNTYEYDNHGNLICMRWNSGMNETYDGQGNTTKIDLLGAVMCDNIYDSTGKLVEHVQHEGKDGKTIYRMKYTYDEQGRLFSKVGGYDRKEPDFTEIRRYNDQGNMTYRGQGVMLEALPFPGFDQDVQASLYYEYFYDEFGRLIRDNGHTYEYDARGNMVKATGIMKNYNEGSWDEYIYE